MAVFVLVFEQKNEENDGFLYSPANILPCERTMLSIDAVQQNEVTIQCMEITRQCVSNQTQRFPKTWSKGSKYTIVVYVQNCNAITVKILKLISEHKMLQSMTKLYVYLKEQEFTKKCKY